MTDGVVKRMIFPLAFVFILFSLSACRATKGMVGFQWGQGERQGEYRKAKKGGPPPHAPAHGYRAKHRYRYFPSCKVYYDPRREIYFYLEGRDWRIVTSLPHTIKLEYGDYVTIEMDTDEPYIYHDEHKRKYPPGQLKKKNEKKENKRLSQMVSQ